ncbi:MAG: thiamine-phosphate kinase, partial [Candidatus Tectomicrobia bacterium]
MTRQPTRTGEFEIIDKYFAPLSQGFAGAHGLTDDTASLLIGDGNEAVITLDTMVSGVHFLPTDPPDLIARKLLRVNLSDLAAAGATPRTYFLSLSLPSSVIDSWIAAFAGGLAADQMSFGVVLGGGDTTSTPGPLTLSLTAIGEAPRGQAISRAGAKPGQDIYVSGTIGDAALALALIQSGGVEQALRDAPALMARYRLPEPRVSLGTSLRGLATAAIDVSDGLIADLGHICRTSAVGAEVEVATVPLSPEAQNLLSKRGDLSERVFTGGDDYELLFTARPEDAGNLSALSTTLGLPLARIGRTIEGDSPVLVSPLGEIVSLAGVGWRH